MLKVMTHSMLTRSLLPNALKVLNSRKIVSRNRLSYIQLAETAIPACLGIAIVGLSKPVIRVVITSNNNNISVSV